MCKDFLGENAIERQWRRKDPGEVVRVIRMCYRSDLS